jgi:predicted amidophosphoribosyltransferase
MIDVACFCGYSFSFSGDEGVCPQCGEPVSFSDPVTDRAWEKRERLRRLPRQSVEDRRDDKAA